jgi:Flp pilus assembly protein TadD
VRPSVRYGIPALISVLALAVFIPSWTGEFLNYDDDHNFTGNLNYRGLGWTQLKWMFTHHYGHYMPLTWLTLGLDYTLWGMNPMGYRVVNSLLHAVNAVLAFFIFLSLFRSARPDRDDLRLRIAAAIGALFFALHPLRAASVAWITERRDVLSGMFFLLTLLTYLRWSAMAPGAARIRGIVLSCVCFVCMLLSKTLGMTLPIVLLILDVWPLRRYPATPFRALIVEKIPYFALMIGGLLLTSLTQGTADTIYTREQYPWIQSLAQPGFRVTFYIAKTLLPLNLSPLYFYRPEIGLPQVLGWAVILLVTAALIVRRRALPAPLATWLAYGLLIAPVSGIVQAGPHFAQDSWTYVTCLPFAALFAGLLLLAENPRPFVIVAAALLVALGIQTVRQSRIWTSSIALWEAAIRVESDVYYSWHNLGRAKAEKGDVDGAIDAFSRAIDLRSGFPDPWHERGLAWSRKQRYSLAVHDFTVVLQLDPGRADAYFHRGKVRALRGDPAGALADLDAAIQNRPLPALYLERGTIRAMGGDLSGAITDWTEAIRLNPQSVDAYVRRGVARLERGEKADAAEDFARALELAPADWRQRKQVEQFLEKARRQE